MSELKISIVGTGYVGLVSGTCFAEMGHNVVCIDSDESKVSGLKAGKMPIYEPDLEDMVIRNVDNQRLHFSTNLKDHLQDSDLVIIAVGTPINMKDGGTNLEYIWSVVDEISRNLAKETIVVIKSTVPPGTCNLIQNILGEKCYVVSNPEFLREGNAIKDFMIPDRIVVGCDQKIVGLMNRLYSDHISRGIRVVYTNCTTSELIKYASNTFLAAKIAFINEMSSIAERIDVNIMDLKEGIGSDSRIGNKFLEPGPGFGGSCFPKDIMSLINFSEKINANNSLIKSIIESNNLRIIEVSSNIAEIVKEGDSICFLGLTYKANTDDVRTSPAVSIIQNLISKGKYLVKCYDPLGIESAKLILKDSVEYYDDIYEAARGVSLVVVATEWDEFSNLDSAKLKVVMKTPRIYDVRNVINVKNFKANGFEVRLIGSVNV